MDSEYNEEDHKLIYQIKNFDLRSEPALAGLDSGGEEEEGEEEREIKAGSVP